MLLLDVCDAPKVRAGQIEPLVRTCPFGTAQTPDLGVCARPNGVTANRKLTAEN